MHQSIRATKQPVLYGISFDAVSLSGVLVEFFKLAEVFHRSGYEIYLDLGYDIFPDKGNFFKQYRDEQDAVPPWVKLTRTAGLDKISGYSEAFIKSMSRRACHAEHPHDADLIDLISASVRRDLTDRILKTWEAHQVDFVVVENGTLPENVVYTAALHDAIEQYGTAHRLDKFVLWRDHDLMWSSETSSKKYGISPYHAVPKPSQSQFIQYVVQHEYNRRRMKEWSSKCDVAILRNRFDFRRSEEMDLSSESLKQLFGIPSDALVLSRLTRIIPQKRIDNELQILARIKILEETANLPDRIFLAVAGNPAEDPEEYCRLQSLSNGLQLENNIVFTGSLLPLGETRNATHAKTTAQLLAQSTLTSFLTSYDYESFGNPPAESIAARVQYVSSQYELYDDVYGDHGMQALLLPVREEPSDAQLWEFASGVLELMLDRRRRQRWIEHNFNIARRLFSLEFLETELMSLFPNVLKPIPAERESVRVK